MSLSPANSTSRRAKRSPSLSPGSLRKSSSCDNVIRRLKSSSASPEIVVNEQTPVCNVMQKTLLAEIKELLPSLVKAAVQQELQNMLKKRDEIKTEIATLTNQVVGYKTQVDKWVALVKTIETTTLPKIIQDVATLETNWKNKEKAITLKTKHFLSTQNKLQNNLTELNNLQTEWEKLLKAKTNGCEIKNIEQSQQFVSDEYEDFREKHEQLASTVASLEEKVAKQAVKSEHNTNYSHWDSLELAGVPVVPVDEFGNENCKEMVINICKELNYWLPASSISTAHRLKKHPSRRGPPTMIVKFNNRDIRNDVYALRKQVKNKYFWNSYNIKKLFINESLTPDARKLFYKTRAWAKNMEPTHGRIFTWTFKGEIFVRKNIETGPKRKILSEDYLLKLTNGVISLDLPTPPVNSHAPGSIVIIEEIMAETTPSVADD